MTREDVTRLLAYIQSFDKRTVGDTDALAWYDILPQDISYEAYRAAIRKHYQQTTKMMMPAELIQLAKLERPVRERLVGEPGEIVCKKCSGVHYPHEDCSVLITIQQYGVQRFWDEVDKRRAELGYGPLDTRRRRKLAGGLVPAEPEPAPEPAPEPVCPTPQEIREAREEWAMPQAFRDAVEERTGIDPGELFKLPEDVEDLSGF